MRVKLWFTILVIVILGILVAPPLAGAETLKWRQTLYVSKVERIEVGDVPGHIVGVAEGGGVAFFERQRGRDLLVEGNDRLYQGGWHELGIYAVHLRGRVHLPAQVSGPHDGRSRWESLLVEGSVYLPPGDRPFRRDSGGRDFHRQAPRGPGCRYPRIHGFHRHLYPAVAVTATGSSQFARGDARKDRTDEGVTL